VMNAGMGRRTGGHQVRESLPPVFTHMNTSDGLNGPAGGVSLSAGGALRMGDSGQEMEVCFKVLFLYV
jgi:hypothetical protein